MKRDAVVLMLADMHSGGTTALFPDRFIEFKHGNHTPTSIQREIYKHWQSVIAFVRTARKDKQLIIINCGDCIEGIHHDNPQVVSADPRDHAEIHIELMNELLRGVDYRHNKGDRLIIAQGTESHTRDMEADIAEELNAEHVTEGIIDINGANIWVIHRGGAGVGKGINKGNAYRNWLKNIYFECLRDGIKMPDVVISAHFHKDHYEPYNHEYRMIHGRALPSWQRKTRYALGVSPFERNDIGAGLMTISAESEITMHRPLLMARVAKQPG